MSFVRRVGVEMRLLLSLLAVSAVSASSSSWLESHVSAIVAPQNDDIWSTLQQLRDFSLPNMGGCEQTRACYLDLLTSTGFETDPLPAYADYSNKMGKDYSKGPALKQFCGTFDAVSHCFSQESDSCRSPTVFATLFNLTSDDAYRFAADLDLRRIMCDNQAEVQDACLNTMAPAHASVPVAGNAAVSCEIAAAGITAMLDEAAVSAACSDKTQSVACQIAQKTKEIETIGACDGMMPKCKTSFTSCDRAQACFDQFYDGVQKAAAMKNPPLPDYSGFKTAMSRKFENPGGIDDMCRYQETLHACLIRHTNKNCPINAASFRKMYNLNYEQAYDYATDYTLRKTQCIHRDGVKQNACLTKAQPLLHVCTPSIPHNLTLGKACTDLRLAMRCNNFAVRQSCPLEAQQMYCATTEIQYQQGALGFCDGWLPSCDDIAPTPPPTDAPTEPTKKPVDPTKAPPVDPTKDPVDPVDPTKKPVTDTTRRTTKAVTDPVDPVTDAVVTTKAPPVTVPVTTPVPTVPTTSLASLQLTMITGLLVTLRLAL